MPARPTPYFVLIQAHFAFGGSKTFFYRPALAGHAYYLFQRGACWGEHPIVGLSCPSSTLRRTSSQRAQPSLRLLVSTAAQSYQRDPLLPAPALNRDQSSGEN